VTGTLRRTPARTRWLRDVDQGLVRITTTWVEGFGTNPGYRLRPQHPQGRVAQAWLADPEVTPLWQARGSLDFRVACLTPAGRRLLAEWSPETGV
jgi:hypothetical protein